MTNTQPPAYSLDDDVLERAAEAHYDHYLRGFATKPDDPTIPTWRTRGPSPDAKRMFVEALRAALPVLGPALRAEAFRDARLYLLDCWRHEEPINADLFGDVITDLEYDSAVRRQDVAFEANDLLKKMEEAERKHLPAAEEREPEGAR